MKTNPFGSGKSEEPATVEGPQAVQAFLRSMTKGARHLPAKKANGNG